MQRLGLFGAVTTVALVLASCAAPPVSRATPTPLFNKSGEALCRPERQPVNATYPARLPVCEDICEGEIVLSNARDIVICPPVQVPRQPGPDDNDDDIPNRDGQQTGQ